VMLVTLDLSETLLGLVVDHAVFSESFRLQVLDLDVNDSLVVLFVSCICPGF
jgi:hypothetical protein